MTKPLLGLLPILCLLGSCARSHVYDVREKGYLGARPEGLHAAVSVSAKHTVTRVVPIVYERWVWREPYTLHYAVFGRFEAMVSFKATAILDQHRRILLPVDRSKMRHLTTADGEDDYYIEGVPLPFGWNDFQDLVIETELTVVIEGRARDFKLSHQFDKRYASHFGSSLPDP